MPAKLGIPLQAGLMDGYTVALTTETSGGWTWFWWHAWASDGSYAGQANTPAMLAQLIADHAARH